MKLAILSSPFKRQTQSTRVIMAQVALACVPGIITQYYFFGIGHIIQILLCLVTAWLCEALVLILRRRPVFHILSDNSALVTAVLLGISIPGYAPWWVAVLGTIFAIILAKHIYGGLGQNIFNPAMAAYVFLLISFPVAMTGWILPHSLIQLPFNLNDGIHLIFSGFTTDGFSLHQLAHADAVSQATPLNAIRTGLTLNQTPQTVMTSPLFSAIGSVAWGPINIAFLIGGIFLMIRRIVRWHIPITFLVVLGLLSLIGYLFDPSKIASPAIELLSGASMFGAFFILTDPVTASTTNKGRIIYATLAAILVFVIRHYGGYPDGVAFAVLIANMCVPLIDHFTQPRVYGYKGKSSHE
ncbi:electron transport complex subunit RsxD [Celerinatantimonas diazotrophica]|uniref:Ion-translocating oxidoreductase complex subunit D n=1 Tax=Celerinatantimonas diazotrophica TaxID=412034 RepID=A0A4R1JA53_9GAMM|nr:electron transport complex subunit RsxD [Celerinatantimonas diazotrophica]TCK47513.1 electron transport complex protein RnfD [Celerinatantimonas diazotrophica]CAG9296869.1 Ion-translocating oxidoreductase complex subunit D [Celerinatantimonas diazotrophica]